MSGLYSYREEAFKRYMYNRHQARKQTITSTPATLE